MSSSWPAFVQARRAERAAGVPPRALRVVAAAFARHSLALMFPAFVDPSELGADATIEHEAQQVERLLMDALTTLVPDAPHRTQAMLACFGGIHDLLESDARAMLKADPAATSLDEVISAYPGFLAVAVHRLAHALQMLAVPLFPRVLAEWAHRETGIDIHPGATIGRGFAIDHGTGVVIGETTLIGERVRLYQGVTLGALAVRKSLANQKRHPTIEDDVVIYANATILGGATVIGAGSIIGGNVWLTDSVPPRSIVQFSSQVAPRPTMDDGLEFHI